MVWGGGSRSWGLGLRTGGLRVRVEPTATLDWDFGIPDANKIRLGGANYASFSLGCISQIANVSIR
jgi:hypothetical protein